MKTLNRVANLTFIGGLLLLTAAGIGGIASKPWEWWEKLSAVAGIMIVWGCALSYVAVEARKQKLL